MLSMHRSLIVLLALATAAVAQDVLVVDAAGGPGSDFTALQPAVDAAHDGDIVVLRTGSYSGAMVVGKALTITADAGSSASLTSSLTIQGVPPGTSLFLFGLTIQGNGFPALAASTCGGTIWVESCSLFGTGTYPTSFSHRAAHFEDCASVVLVNSVFFAGESSGSGLMALSLEQGTRASAYKCTFQGSDAHAITEHIGGDGGQGARLLTGSSLFAADCNFRGGDGGPADDQYDFMCDCIICGLPGTGGTGITASNSSVRLLGGSLAPGAGGQSLSLEPACVDGEGGAPLSLPGSTSAMVPGPARRLSITPNVAHEGDPLDFVFSGQAGDFATWVLALPGLPLQPAASDTPLLLAPPLVLIPLAPVASGGTLHVATTVPPLPPGLEGGLLTSQGLFAAQDGYHLSNGTVTVLLDASL